MDLYIIYILMILLIGAAGFMVGMLIAWLLSNFFNEKKLKNSKKTQAAARTSNYNDNFGLSDDEDDDEEYADLIPFVALTNDTPSPQVAPKQSQIKNFFTLSRQDVFSFIGEMATKPDRFCVPPTTKERSEHGLPDCLMCGDRIFALMFDKEDIAFALCLRLPADIALSLKETYTIDKPPLLLIDEWIYLAIDRRLLSKKQVYDLLVLSYDYTARSYYDFYLKADGEGVLANVLCESTAKNLAKISNYTLSDTSTDDLIETSADTSTENLTENSTENLTENLNNALARQEQIHLQSQQEKSKLEITQARLEALVNALAEQGLTDPQAQQEKFQLKIAQADTAQAQPKTIHKPMTEQELADHQAFQEKLQLKIAQAKADGLAEQEFIDSLSYQSKLDLKILLAKAEDDYKLSLAKLKSQYTSDFRIGRKEICQDYQALNLPNFEVVTRFKTPQLPASIKFFDETIVMLYATDDGVLMIVQIDSEFADELSKFHPEVRRAKFPKGAFWYAVPLDGAFEDKEAVYKIIDRAKEFYHIKKIIPKPLSIRYLTPDSKDKRVKKKNGGGGNGNGGGCGNGGGGRNGDGNGKSGSGSSVG
ncbi:MAG: hypothetical protein FWD86_02815 [Firmicutes bacterium]|nr:hypothetical protein [Bacillota bacterium]